MKVQRLEDLRCWQAARSPVKEVFEEGKLAKDFDTKGQIRRAALATMNNIAEGFGRFSTKDSIKFYDISQSSAIEVLSICYVLSDLNYLTPKESEEYKKRLKKLKIGHWHLLTQIVQN